MLSALISYQGLTLTASVSILHKLLSFKPSTVQPVTNETLPTGSMVKSLCTTLVTGDSVLLQCENDLLFLIKHVTDQCAPVIKSFGPRVCYVISETVALKTANCALASELGAWVTKSFPSIFSSSSMIHSSEEERLSTDSNLSMRMGNLPMADGQSKAVGLQLSLLFQDSDDEVMGHAVNNPTFLKTYVEEFDSKLEYKTQLESSIYNERERVSDYMVELIRQYNDASRNDLSGSKMAEFLSKLQANVYSKVVYS